MESRVSSFWVFILCSASTWLPFRNFRGNDSERNFGDFTKYSYQALKCCVLFCHHWKSFQRVLWGIFDGSYWTLKCCVRFWPMLWGWFRETCGLTLLKGENTHQVKNERTVHASTKKEVVQKEMESSSKHHFFRGELLVSVSGDASRIWTFRIMGPNPGWKLIWPWKITMFNWRSIFKWLSFRCHVKIFWGVFVDGISSKSNKNPIYPWIQSFVEVGFPPKNGLLYCFFQKRDPFLGLQTRVVCWWDFRQKDPTWC